MVNIITTTQNDVFSAGDFVKVCDSGKPEGYIGCVLGIQDDLPGDRIYSVRSMRDHDGLSCENYPDVHLQKLTLSHNDEHKRAFELLSPKLRQSIYEFFDGNLNDPKKIVLPSGNVISITPDSAQHIISGGVIFPGKNIKQEALLSAITDGEKYQWLNSGGHCKTALSEFHQKGLISEIREYTSNNNNIVLAKIMASKTLQSSGKKGARYAPVGKKGLTPADIQKKNYRCNRTMHTCFPSKMTPAEILNSLSDAVVNAEKEGKDLISPLNSYINYDGNKIDVVVYFNTAPPNSIANSFTEIIINTYYIKTSFDADSLFITTDYPSKDVGGGRFVNYSDIVSLSFNDQSAKSVITNDGPYGPVVSKVAPLSISIDNGCSKTENLKMRIMLRIQLLPEGRL